MIKACYSERYFADTPTASMRKLPPVAKAVREAGYAELIDPGSKEWPSVVEAVRSLIDAAPSPSKVV